MEGPAVYRAIAAVIADLSTTGIAKLRTNEQDRYRFRGIDDLYGALSPLLAKHRICMLPRITERKATTRRGAGGSMTSVVVKVEFDIVSADDGSRHVIEAYGEAIDPSDKATAKAMSAAFKYAAFQTFCIPIAGMDDADSVTHHTGASALTPPHWADWVADIQNRIGTCANIETLDRLQASHRPLLRLLSHQDAGLYDSLGEAIRARRAELAAPASLATGNIQPITTVRSRRRRPNVQPTAEAVDAA